MQIFNFINYLYFIFILLLIIIVLSILKDTSNFRIITLFLTGLILSTIVSGSIYYHTQLCGVIKIIADSLHSIVGIALVYIVIPSVIALSILSKDNYFKQTDLIFIFLLIVLFESFGLLYKLPNGYPPIEALVKLKVTRMTLIFNDLINYLTAVAIPVTLCYTATKTKNPTTKALLIFMIPVVYVILDILLVKILELVPS